MNTSIAKKLGRVHDKGDQGSIPPLKIGTPSN